MLPPPRGVARILDDLISRPYRESLRLPRSDARRVAKKAKRMHLEVQFVRSTRVPTRRIAQESS